MTNQIVNVLVIEQPQHDVSQWEKLSLPNFSLHFFYGNNFKDAVRIVLEKSIDIIIFENSSQSEEALEFLAVLHHLSLKLIPTIVLASDEKLGLQAFRKGARDFIVTDENNLYLSQVAESLEKILQEESRNRDKYRLMKSNEAVLDAISDGVIGVNLDGTIIFANPAAAVYLQQPFEDLICKPIQSYVEKIERSFLQNLITGMKQVQASNQAAVIGQFNLSLSENRLACTVEICLTPIFNEMVRLEGYVLTFKDISETKHLSDMIHQRSIQDDLTGLVNRKTIIYRLEHAISYSNRYQTKCAVLFIDLDGFKIINDALGRPLGDELLLKVADRIKKVIREIDILGRVGADEFVVLLTHVNHPNDAARVSMKINQALLKGFELNGNKYFITASIGVALYPNDSSDAETLVQYADFAMSLVKKRGKNSYQYYKSDLNADAERMIKLSSDLRLAVQSDQLELYFHPQLDAKTEKLAGLESLIRWFHPKLGLIPPNIFIPIAEEIGIIGDIGQWVFNKTCQCYLAWQKEGLENFTLSINLSIQELQRDEFISNVEKNIETYPINPNRIQFEITESIFAHDAQFVIHKLHHLKQMGFQIAMDDFGTGYSCLSYLKDLPIDMIKVDRSFIQSLSFQDNQRHKAIIGAIIDLAKRLGMTTLAEGVETEEQASYLRELHCDYFQGFLFAKPMPFAEATKYIYSKMGTEDEQYFFKSRS